MNLEYGSPTDIENWMHLVDRIKLNFPGLEAEEKLLSEIIENDVSAAYRNGARQRRDTAKIGGF